MRIFLLVSDLRSGGAERVACTLAEAWVGRGDEVDLVATYFEERSSFYPLDSRVRARFIGDIVGRDRSRGLIRQAVRLQALRRLIRETKPDVVVSFLTNVNVIAVLATLGLPVPVIVCERIDPRREKIPVALAMLRRLTYRWADAVTVQTQELAAALGPRWLGSRRLHVVPNPLPPALEQRFAGAPVARGTAPTLAAVGRLAPQKQFDRLIAAFARCVAPEWRLRIFGEGADRAKLEQQIEAGKLVGRVELAGVVTDIWDQLARADVFVLASSHEGFPNALLEAMALGLPCISFACPCGPREMTDEGRDALLVEQDDWDGLTEALQRLMDDATLRRQIGERAAASVRIRYAVPAVLARWDALFDAIRARR